jgi:peptidoglycan/LPS O-acetylase OafA/YrhL
MLDRSAQGRIPELDGLRGAAILFVVFYHYAGTLTVSSPHSWTCYIQRLSLMGWSGVDLFFVLSGFLIGGILLDVRGSASYFRTFYARRFFRIIPIYYAWILGYIFLVNFAGSVILAYSKSGVVRKPGFPIYGHFLFLQNLTVISFLGLSTWWFAPLWSLAVEEQFYLVSPLVVRLFSPRGLKLFLFSVVAGAPLLRILLVRAVHTDPMLVYQLMPCRADSLAVGMLAALFWRATGFREWLSGSGGVLYGLLAVLLAAVTALWKWSPGATTWGMESAGFTCLALFYVLILFLALTRPAGPIARLARARWLREMGRVSYCMYIIHAAVFVVLSHMSRRALPSISDAEVTLLAALATYGIAWFSWQFFEGPLLRRGHAFKY